MMSKNVLAALLLVAMVTLMAAEEEPKPDPSPVPGVMYEEAGTSSTSEPTQDPDASKTSPVKGSSPATGESTTEGPKPPCNNKERRSKCHGRKAKKNNKDCSCHKSRD